MGLHPLVDRLRPGHCIICACSAVARGMDYFTDRRRMEETEIIMGLLQNTDGS